MVPEYIHRLYITLSPSSTHVIYLRYIRYRKNVNYFAPLLTTPLQMSYTWNTRTIRNVALLALT